MNACWKEELRPGPALHTLVQEATAALIAMDAERLEELARCCADLNGELRTGSALQDVAASADAIVAETKLLGRILIETRANLAVLSRLHVVHLREHLDSICAQESSARTIDRHHCPGGSYGDN